MALANVAWILAANRKRVLVLDWDLEAPGLHRYYHPFLEDKELTSSEGIIDFVINFAAEALNPSGSQEKDWYLPFADILRYACSLNWEFPQPGTIDFVPAGRQGPDYASRVNSFNWEKFYEQLGGGVFLEAAKQNMSDYDYVLIDSRTGVSDTSGVCTIQMPDKLVICFTYNIQSIEGAAAVAESALNQRQSPDGQPTIRIFPVPMRVEFSEKVKLDLAKDAARERFNPLLWHMSEDERAGYWERVQVNYQAFYAYEETLATFGDKPREPDTLLSRMEVIAEYLTDAKVARLPSLPEDKRLAWRAKFARQPKLVRPRAREADNRFWFYFSYAANYANEYVTKFFQDLQYEIQLRTGTKDDASIGFFDRDRIELGAEWSEMILSALQSSKTMVCLFSPRYFDSEFCGREFQIFRSRMEVYRQNSLGPEPGTILPVLLTPVSVIPPAVADIQYSSSEFPHVYNEQGLLYMMRLRKFRDDYEEFVSLFGKHLIEVATQYELPALETVPSLADTANAFAHKPQTPTAAQAGPSQAEFRFVVANETGIPLIVSGRDMTRYGTQGWEWKPFMSQIETEVGLLAQLAAVQETFVYRTRPVDGDLIKQLEEADRTNVVVILVVDPWSLRMPFFKSLMEEFDSRVFVNCGVLILWDMNDAETSTNREALEVLVRTVFSRQLLSSSPQFFRPSVKSEDEFAREARTMLTTLRVKVLERARLLRPVMGDEIIGHPSIARLDQT